MSDILEYENALANDTQQTMHQQTTQYYEIQQNYVVILEYENALANEIFLQSTIEYSSIREYKKILEYNILFQNSKILYCIV